MIKKKVIDVVGRIVAERDDLRKQLAELREAATGVCWQALSTDAVEGMRVVPIERIETLKAALDKVSK